MNNEGADSPTHYWSVEIPGLTQEQARWVQERISSDPYRLQAELVDPGSFLTVHLDVESARTIRDSLASRDIEGVAGGLQEIINDWLESIEESEG